MALDEGHYRVHAIAKITVDRVEHAGPHDEPAAHREEDDDERQTEKVPDGEPKMDGETGQSEPSLRQ